jgi:hypothetical protein
MTGMESLVRLAQPIRAYCTSFSIGAHGYVRTHLKIGVERLDSCAPARYIGCSMPRYTSPLLDLFCGSFLVVDDKKIIITSFSIFIVFVPQVRAKGVSLRSLTKTSIA